MIIYEVVFDGVFLLGFIMLCNQGMVEFDQLFDVLIDDFEMLMFDDLMIILVIFMLILQLMKVVDFEDDVDISCLIMFGDVLCYIVVIISGGDVGFINVIFDDILDVNMQLVVGSVMMS